MRNEMWTRLSSGIHRATSAPRLISWKCRTCRSYPSKQPLASSLSARPITTRVKPSTRRSMPGLQGLAESELQELPIEAPKRQALSATEKRAIQRLGILLEDSQAILHRDTIPTEQEILDSLRTCNGLAEYFKAIQEQPALTTVKPGGEAGNLLFLESSTRDDAEQQLSPIAIGKMAATIADNAIDMISAAVNRIAEDEKVFVTPTILSRIVSILALLGRPENLAQIFILYAEKPVPVAGSKPVTYNPANPNKIAAAVPLDVARIGLEAGIKAQNLPLCLDIMEHTVCKTAYKRSKVARKALLPGVVAAAAPLAAYSIASHFAEMQEGMSTSMMTIVGTLGIATYLGTVGTMGFITIATANDQMERVTWAPGQHMRQRWVREDERAFMDKIACAWGFQDRYRRGEEEGPDWEALKELCNIRGMILDRVELMDGMQ